MRPGGERMPVPTLYPERVLLKLRAGPCANISAVLKPGLTRTEFIRLAIDEKIAQLRREAGIGVVTVVIGKDQTVGAASLAGTANQADGEDRREPPGLPAPVVPAGASF